MHAALLVEILGSEYICGSNDGIWAETLRKKAKMLAFLPFPQCLQKPHTSTSLKIGTVW